MAAWCVGSVMGLLGAESRRGRVVTGARGRKPRGARCSRCCNDLPRAKRARPCASEGTGWRAGCWRGVSRLEGRNDQLDSLAPRPRPGQLARLAAGVPRVEREGLAHRPGEPEGAEVERVVAGLAARDGDQELLGVAREGDDVALDVATLLELRPVRAVPALDRRARPLEEHLLHVGYVDAVARDLVREVGAEEEEHVALLLLHQYLVVADPVDRVSEHPDELLAGLGPDVGDVLRAGGARGGHDAVGRGEAAAHVEGRPRASLLPLAEAERDAPWLAEDRLADRARDRAAHVAHDEAERPP